MVLVLPFNSETNKIAVKVARELKAKSKFIEIPDLFIASTALKNKVKLATLNKKYLKSGWIIAQ